MPAGSAISKCEREARAHQQAVLASRGGISRVTGRA